MRLKSFLILMTLVAVVSDYLLHPFYPQFFQARFGVENPEAVGNYFAAICLMVMVAFPFWAWISKKVAELNILVYTQLVAGLLALYCFWTSSYTYFWVVSLIMILFKGSYLLVYPYILRIVTSEEHAQTIGLLSVVVHMGGILGAVIGGLTVGLIDPSYIFLIMALGDFIQMGMSLYLLRSRRFDTRKTAEDRPTAAASGKFLPQGYILKIGLVTLILYFSGFLIRPFFSRYWESISVFDSTLVSGTIYAIPGFVALIALWFTTKRPSSDTGRLRQAIVSALLVGCVGLLLQGLPYGWVVILGRIIYGWAIFQATVKFDVLLFELSTPSSYAIDYSKVHFFQNLGVLLASYAAGILVGQYGLQIPFGVALAGFTFSLGLYWFLFGVKAKARLEALAKT